MGALLAISHRLRHGAAPMSKAVKYILSIPVAAEEKTIHCNRTAATEDTWDPP